MGDYIRQLTYIEEQRRIDSLTVDSWKRNSQLNLDKGYAIGYGLFIDSKLSGTLYTTVNHKVFLSKEDVE